MTYSDDLREIIKRWECPGGIPFLEPHWDKFGKVWDIGYGHVIKQGEDVGPDNSITEEEAEMLLDWDLPRGAQRTPGERIVFPGPTVARKGAYELRAAARQLGLTIVPLGSELEGPGFWEGVATAAPEGNWLAGADMAGAVQVWSLA